MFHFELSHLISEIDSGTSIRSEIHSKIFPMKCVQLNHHQLKTKFVTKPRIKKISPCSVAKIKPQRKNSLEKKHYSLGENGLKVIQSDIFKERFPKNSRYNWSVKEENVKKYTETLERLENFELKNKTNYTGISTTLFTCLVCRYTSEKPLKRCKILQHSFNQKSSIKRIFYCKDCNGKKEIYDSKYPREICDFCSSVVYSNSLPIPAHTTLKDERLLERGFEETSIL